IECAARSPQPVRQSACLQLSGAGRMTTTNLFSAPAPVTRRVRAYFAPVNRAAQTPVLFDPSQSASFDMDAPPAPWIDLGWIQNFARKSASKSTSILTGIPAAALEQTRGTLEAHLAF